MERGLTDQMTPIGSPKGRYCPDCSQESASATGKHTEMAAAFTSEWLGSERQWLKPGQVQTACVKSQLCHSQGTNTGKVQPKGTKAAPGQGLLRVKYFPKRGCGWIGWYKIFTDTMNRTISCETNSICFQHNSLGENTTNNQFRSFFSFFNPLKFYKVLIENPQLLTSSILEHHTQDAGTFILTEGQSSPQAELVRFINHPPCHRPAVHEQIPGTHSFKQALKQKNKSSVSLDS